VNVLLVPAHPGFPGQIPHSRKTVVCVCVYQTWKIKMELLLTKEKLWNVVTDDPPDPVTDEWSNKDKQARATIGLLLEDSQLHIIRKETSSKAT